MYMLYFISFYICTSGVFYDSLTRILVFVWSSTSIRNIESMIFICKLHCLDTAYGRQSDVEMSPMFYVTI